MMEVARPCSITIQQPSCVVCVTDDDFADENVLETFSLSRSHALQRSQDSGAVTDWSRGSPTRHSCKSQDSLLSDGSREDPTKFVTVLSVNGGLGDRPSSPSPEAKLSRTNPDFVTVLAIGETAEGSVIYPTSTGSISLRIGSPPPTENERTGAKSPDHTDEVVTLIRRPGEKLGFGLKFDGGSEKNQRVRRLFIQCCAPGSAASSVHCTWGKLGEADEILDICGEPVTRLTRAQVVHQLTEGSTALLLIIRHLWNEQRRNEVRAKYLRSASAKEKSRLPKKRCEPQERAVDVPVEFLYSQMSGGLRDSWQLNRHLAACEELAPPVPPRRKRRSKKMTETTASSASPIKSSDDSPLFRSLPGTGRVVCNGIRVNSTAPNKPPRLRLQQSRSLGDERAAANDSRPTPASAEVAFLNCLLPPAGFITDDQRQQKGPGDTVVIDLHEDEVNGDDATARHSQTSLLMAEPPEAEVYINLIAEEDRRLSSLLDLESESDTNSSVSTIIDCWSIAPSSPSYTSLNRSKTFQDSAVESLESLHSLRMQRFNSADLLRGLVRESAPMALMNQRYSQAADSDAEHDSGVGTTDETEPSSLGDDVIDPPETFLDHPQPARDAEDVTEIVETVVGLQVGQIPAPDGSTLSSLPEEPAAECCDMVTDCAIERSPKELNESCSDAETPSREGEEQDATTDGVASIPVRREGPAVEFQVEPTPTAVSVAERSSAQSGAEGSSPPARKLPTAVQSESTATGTSSAPNNKININSNINSSRSSKSSSINGDSKLTQSTIDESAGPNKSKARRSRIPQVAVVPFKAGSVSRSAVAVINKKTPSRAASTSRIPLTGVAATRAAPVSTVGRSNSSVAVNKIGTSVLTRPVNGARTTSVATPSRSAYCDVDNKAKEKEKPKRNVKSGLAAPTPATGSVHAASSRIPRPCPPKKAYSPLANKTHSPGVVAANVKATPSSRPVDSTPVKTVKKKPVGSSQLPQQANHHQGASMERMSLSSSPPSSRLPPDGHEFPANYDENSADLTSSKCRPVRSGSGGNAAANWRSNRDERSERSVRDKIALFTHDDRGQIRSTAAGSVPATPSVASTGPLKSRRENTSLGSSPPDTKYVAKTLSYSVDNLSSSSSINNNNSTSNGNSNNNNNSTSTTLKTLQGSAKGPLSCSSPRSRDFSSTTGDSSNLSERSRSLLDVAQSSHKRHSVGNLAATLAQRKTSLMNLAESRRKSISKLRGLVIPDPVEIKTDARLRSPRGIIDMPEIISKDSVLAQGKAVNLPTLSRTDPLRGSQSSVTSSTSSGHDAPDSALKKTSLTSLPWKSNSASNTLPKYSPAFKRKELTVPRSYVLDSGQVERPASDAKTAATATNKTPPVPLLPLPPLPKPAVLSSTKELINSVDSRTPSTVTSSHSHEESSDTDGDSALSSSRSSFSQSESPIPSVDHKDEVKIDHQESSTAAVSAAAAAARVLKAHSVEALNRKNVLQSARYSSGGGLDSLTSPPIPAESRPLKLSSPTSPNRSSDSLSSPKDPSPLLARSRKAPDFEQTLKMFASTEKEAKSERASPKSLRSGDRLEIKTAFINDVYDDPNSIQTTTRDRTDVKVSPVDVTVLPSPVTRKVSSGSESSRRNSNEMDSKILAAKASGGSGSSQRETPREVKSFRALAERWEAMANDAPPVSSGSSSPLSPPAKLFPPVQAAPVTASKKMEVKQVEEDDDFPMKRFSLLSKLTQETTAYESSLENGDHESSFTVVTSSLSTSSSSRSSKSMAGVVEIRKAFERVREELETESNSNMDLPMNLNAADELSSETFNIFKPHGIFSMSSTSNFASNSSCSTSYHTRMSSLDSNASGEDCSFPYGGFGHYGIGIGLRDHYGSITSLASSTSLISPQELQQLLDDANQSLEESGTPSHEIVVVVLHRGDASGPASLGLGITLAGGADYETKEITVHKVISGSVADRDGRVQRGDRVLSINGKSLKGVTHREALAILKAPRPEVVLVLSRKRSVSPQDQCSDDKDLPMMIASSNTIINSRIGSSGHVISSRPPRILESPSDFGNYDTDEDISRGPPLTTTLIKDGAGLGFSLEGGKDSPLGDRPLTVKKIFTGGAASKNGVLRVGDQIITVNGCDVTVMSRIEAWNLMKKLPDGVVTLVIRQSLNPASS